MELGTLVLTGVPGVENLNGPPGFDGTIGLALLRNFNLLIDYSESEVVLFNQATHPDFLAQEQWTEHRFAGGMQVRVRLDFSPKRYAVDLDTGNNVTAIPKTSPLGRAMMEGLGLGNARKTVNQRTGAEVYLYELEHVYLGDHDLGKMRCVLVEAPHFAGNGFLGFDFFNNNKVFIDFSGKKLWLRDAGES